MAITNPYFAKTDEQGRFTMADVPPGTYKLVIWHPYIRTASLSRDRSGGRCGRARNRLSRYEEYSGGTVQALLRTALKGIEFGGPCGIWLKV